MTLDPLDVLKEIERRYPEQFLICVQALQIELLTSQLDHDKTEPEE